MQPVEFHKDYARYLLDCIDSGRPIEPPDGRAVWTHRDQLMLAGVACFALRSHGPVIRQPDLSDEQAEHQEGAEGEELLATIAFVSGLFMAVMDDEYDERWEPVMRCAVIGNGLPAKVAPIAGWRRI